MRSNCNYIFAVPLIQANLVDSRLLMDQENLLECFKVNNCADRSIEKKLESGLDVAEHVNNLGSGLSKIGSRKNYLKDSCNFDCLAWQSNVDMRPISAKMSEGSRKPL